MKEEELRNMMNGLACASIEMMSLEDKKVALQFAMRQIAKNGTLTEDDCRVIIDFDMAQMNKRFAIRQHFESLGMEIIND